AYRLLPWRLLLRSTVCDGRPVRANCVDGTARRAAIRSRSGSWRTRISHPTSGRGVQSSALRGTGGQGNCYRYRRPRAAAVSAAVFGLSLLRGILPCRSVATVLGPPVRGAMDCHPDRRRVNPRAWNGCLTLGSCTRSALRESTVGRNGHPVASLRHLIRRNVLLATLRKVDCDAESQTAAWTRSVLDRPVDALDLQTHSVPRGLRPQVWRCLHRTILGTTSHRNVYASERREGDLRGGSRRTLCGRSQWVHGRTPGKKLVVVAGRHAAPERTKIDDAILPRRADDRLRRRHG